MVDARHLEHDQRTRRRSSSDFLLASVSTKVLGQTNSIEEAFKHCDLGGKGAIQLSEARSNAGEGTNLWYLHCSDLRSSGHQS